MKLNQQLFKHSCANPEPDFDDAYTIRGNHDLLDEYFESAKSLTRILEKFKVEKDPNKKNAPKHKKITPGSQDGPQTPAKGPKP